VETIPIPVDITQVDVVVLKPEKDEPSMLFLCRDDSQFLIVFGDDAECNAYWSGAEAEFINKGFVRFYGIFFRAAALKTLEKSSNANDGPFLRLVFSNSFEFRQPYESEQQLISDMKKVTDILTLLQEQRAMTHTSSTQQ
jgi:hypothetical protein